MQVSFEVDEHHWWYRGRRVIIGRELERLGLPPELRILDAGCGSGRTMLDLAPLGEVSGIEYDADAAALARSRGDFEVEQGVVEELPWEDDSFDLVTCLDVIEHTRDDVVSLKELRRVTRPGGVLLVTVPAYQWLWSRHDVANQHYRRYSRRTLANSLSAAGWHVERTTHFNSLLLPAAVLVRMLERDKPVDDDYRSDLELGSGWLNRLLELPLQAEARWLESGHTLPAGLSLLAVARNA